MVDQGEVGRGVQVAEGVVGDVRTCGWGGGVNIAPGLSLGPLVC